MLNLLRLELGQCCSGAWVNSASASTACEAVERIFRPGYRYSKAEVLLLDLRQPGEFTDDLFAKTQPAVTDQMMKLMDDINGRWGRGTVRSAKVPAVPEWGMRRDMLSPSYTTRLDQLLTVRS